MTERPPHMHGAAVAVAVDADGPLAGALLLGAPGAGKSGLALSLVENCPWRRTALVADDLVLLSQEAGGLVARAAPGFTGLVEARGFGPARVRSLAETRLVAGFELETRPARDGNGQWRSLAGGAALPVWPLAADAAAPARLRAGLRSILGGQTP